MESADRSKRSAVLVANFQTGFFMFSDDNHLAVVTPIDSSESNQVMNRLSLLMNSVKLIFVQTMWIWFAVAGMWMLGAPQEIVNRLGVAAWSTAIVLLLIQFCLVFVYPEWPVNTALCQRLRDSVLNRNDRASWVFQDAEIRVVELVPRERWHASSFETATDLLMLRVDTSGVWMEGDCDRYELPPESILGAEFVSIRPSGWFTSTNMVVITVRTAAGPIELPIAFRDHTLGTLRNSRRRMAAIALANDINLIAKGVQYRVDAPVVALIHRRSPSLNPYAAPAAG